MLRVQSGARIEDLVEHLFEFARDLWEINQEAKGRGFVQMLGISRTLPPVEVESLPGGVKGLVDEEQELVRRLEDAPASEHAALWSRIDSLRGKMRENGSLARMMSTRDGRAADYGDIQTLQKHSTRRVVLFDWVVVNNLFHVFRH